MITSSQWASLKFLRRADFKNPDQMQWVAVQNLDLLAQRLGTRPVITSDWRSAEYNRTLTNSGTSQHILGLAIDHKWPGLDPLNVADTIRGSRLFTGVGIYRDPHSSAVFFHTDNRSDRTVDNPAQWGDLDSSRTNQYTSWNAVISALSKAAPIGGVLLLIGIALIIWNRS